MLAEVLDEVSTAILCWLWGYIGNTKALWEIEGLGNRDHI